jgi:hypothetical protein
VTRFSVTIAAAFGGVERIDEFLAAEKNSIPSKILSHIEEKREDAISIGEDAAALLHFFDWALRPKSHEEGIEEAIETLLESRLTPVLKIAQEIVSGLPEERRKALPPELSPDLFEREDEKRRVVKVPKHKRTPDSIMNQSVEEVMATGDTSLIFSYLRDHISNSNHLDKSLDLITLALELGKMDDALNLMPIFESHSDSVARNLLHAYDWIGRNNLKRAVNLINKTDLGKDEAQIFTARLLFSHKSYKRAIEICEGLVKQRPLHPDAYPLLIPAFRSVGDEKKAVRAEAAWNQIKEAS